MLCWPEKGRGAQVKWLPLQPLRNPKIISGREDPTKGWSWPPRFRRLTVVLQRSKHPSDIKGLKSRGIVLALHATLVPSIVVHELGVPLNFHCLEGVAMFHGCPPVLQLLVTSVFLNVCHDVMTSASLLMTSASWSAVWLSSHSKTPLHTSCEKRVFLGAVYVAGWPVRCYAFCFSSFPHLGAPMLDANNCFSLGLISSPRAIGLNSCLKQENRPISISPPSNLGTSFSPTFESARRARTSSPTYPAPEMYNSKVNTQNNLVAKTTPNSLCEPLSNTSDT